MRKNIGSIREGEATTNASEGGATGGSENLMKTNSSHSWKDATKKISGMNQFISILGQDNAGGGDNDIEEDIANSLSQWYLDTLDEVQWQDRSLTNDKY